MVTPASLNLYNVRTGDTNPLDKEENDEYHSITTQCLHLSKRVRPDLHEYIACHCTRVNTLDEDDQKKLTRTVQYLEETKRLLLILGMSTEGGCYGR